MNGKYFIKIKDGKNLYQFNIKRKVTVLTGDSANRKTRLLNALQDSTISKVVLDENGNKLKSIYRVILDNNYEDLLDGMYENKLIFIDENLVYDNKSKFISFIEHSNNYFIIVTRDATLIDKRYFERILFSIEELYRIDLVKGTVENKLTFKTCYNAISNNIIRVNNLTILVEDKVSGYFFFKDNLPGIKVLTSLGRESIHSILLGKTYAYERTHSMPNTEKGIQTTINDNDNVIVIADGAALGSQIDLIYQAIEERHGMTTLLAPESFEYLLLKVFDTPHRKIIDTMLSKPYNFIDTKNDGWCSWEVFFTNMLRYYTNSNNKEVDTSLFKTYDKNNSSEFYKYFKEVIKLLGLEYLIKDSQSNYAEEFHFDWSTY